MKIGYCVEGSFDRAILEGLRNRWCPHAELVEGRFRGNFPRSQIPKECRTLSLKGADLIIFLRDANREDWRTVLQADRAKCPPDYEHKVIFGVCDRNAEWWLAADLDYLANQVEKPRNEFKHDDPSPAIKAAFGSSVFSRPEAEPLVAQFVAKAPLANWLSNGSFKNFYDQARQKSKELGCLIENLHDNRRE